MTSLLIVDDEPDIRSLIRRYFSKLGFKVYCAASGSEMALSLAEHSIDIVILDVCLPDASGMELLPGIKQRYQSAVIMLTAQSRTEQRVDGLNRGADDYLPKPFDLSELEARINAVLRRKEPVQEQRVVPRLYRFGEFRLDTRTRSLYREPQVEIKLTPAEYDLLLVLLKNPGAVLDRDFLMLSTRGRLATAHDRAIDVRMGQLRKKLALEKPGKCLFSTVRGGGYMLDCEVTISQDEG